MCRVRCCEVMGLPYSLFKVALLWWRSALLNLFNLCLQWNDVSNRCGKHSVVVPVFKTGDHSVPGNYRQIFGVMLLQSVGAYGPFQNCSSHFAAVAPLPGGFHWGADMMAGSLTDVLHMQSATHTFVAFVDIFKAFDTSSLGGPKAHVGP